MVEQTILFPEAKKEKQASWNAGNYADGRKNIRKNFIDDASPQNKGECQGDKKLSELFTILSAPTAQQAFTWAVKNYPLKSRKLTKKLNIY